MKKLETPYYLIDERKLLENLKIIAKIRERAGTKSVLALKCFSTWCVFDLMRQYMDGTTSSSLFEARLGYRKFGKETHAFSVAYPKSEVIELAKFADKIIFNSTSQLERLAEFAKGIRLGLRVNPGFSYSHFDLADPARKYSRLGVADITEIERVSKFVSGLMFHYNCENDDFANFAKSLDAIGEKYGHILKKMEWISLGGGIYFTKPGYPVDSLCQVLKNFTEKYGIQIYLEPGESAITSCGELVTTVLDVVNNEIDIAIVDASLEAHMLDHLVYRTTAKLAKPGPGSHRQMIAGRSCLAGDIFGTYNLEKKLLPGDEVRFADAAGYTMVKKNWFNGIPMPSIVVTRLDGSIELIRKFTYREFENSLS